MPSVIADLEGFDLVGEDAEASSSAARTRATTRGACSAT
jgi:hypothetical protein